MPKIVAPQSLQLVTLSGTYEAARDVTRLTKIEVCSTFDRLAQQLKTLSSPKGREDLIRLHQALDRLDRASMTLGLTTLVQPADHPLVIRQTAVFPKNKA